MAIEHTSSSLNEILSLPIEWKGKSIVLDYPDYGGEQVKEIIEQRQINDRWQTLVTNSDYWLLFINIDDLQQTKDITTAMIKPIEKTSEAITTEFKFSQQAFFVELLQMLLYAKGLGLHRTVKQPKLCVALSCWDTLGEELIATTKPIDYLKEHLPFLHQFIGSLWQPSACSVIGLSSQGKALSRATPDAAYLEQGYYEFGYIITPNGTKNKDLTWVLANLLEE